MDSTRKEVMVGLCSAQLGVLVSYGFLSPDEMRIVLEELGHRAKDVAELYTRLLATAPKVRGG